MEVAVLGNSNHRCSNKIINNTTNSNQEKRLSMVIIRISCPLEVKMALKTVNQLVETTSRCRCAVKITVLVMVETSRSSNNSSLIQHLLLSCKVPTRVIKQLLRQSFPLHHCQEK